MFALTTDVEAHQEVWRRGKDQIKFAATAAGQLAEDVIELAAVFHSLNWKKLPPRAILYRYLTELHDAHQLHRGPHQELEQSVNHCLRHLHRVLNPRAIHSQYAQRTPLPMEPELYDSLTGTSLSPRDYLRDLYTLSTRASGGDHHLLPLR